MYIVNFIIQIHVINKSFNSKIINTLKQGIYDNMSTEEPNGLGLINSFYKHVIAY